MTQNDIAAEWMPARAASDRAAGLCCGVLIAGITAIVYLPSISCDFVNLDDPQYVTANPYVLMPSWGKLGRFFAEVTHPTTVAGYYQPLTMASLMLDRVIDWAGPPHASVYHRTNVILHALNAALVFAWLRGLMGAGRSGAIARLVAPMAAALAFGLHPVNVEAVAWVCQRKALLSTTFALAALLAYGGYAERRGWIAYGLTAIFFVLSLLAKPTGWLLPLVFVLLDVWPLGMRRRAAMVKNTANGVPLTVPPVTGAWLAKMPLFAMAAMGGWVAYVSQLRSMGRARIVVLDSPIEGLLILCHNVRFYLGKLAWPATLSPQYPLPPSEEIAWGNPAFAWGVAVSAALVVLLGVAVWRGWRAVWVSFGGFLVLIAPVLGGVDFMGAIAADRFAYLPMLMLLPLAAEGMLRLCGEGAGLRRIAVVAAALVVTVLLGAKTYVQQAVWSNSFSYWARCHEYGGRNAGVCYGLANAHLAEYDPLLDRDAAAALRHLDEAEQLFRETIRRRQSHALAYFGLSQVLVMKGRPAEALDVARAGRAFPSADVAGWLAEGRALSRLGRYAEAIPAYERYLEQRPTEREALRNLGNALCAVGRWRDAEQTYLRLIEVDAADGEAFYGLGRARFALGGDAAAIEPLEAARARRPADARLRLALAARYAGVGRDAEARRELSAAVRMKPELLRIAEREPRFERLHATAFWGKLRGAASRPGAKLK